MKKLIFLFTMFLFSMFPTQENFEVNTLGIGPYKVFMKAIEAEKISNKNLTVFEEFDKKNSVILLGEIIEIQVQNIYLDENETNAKCIISISTQSKKFKTKEGLGVGDTKEKLIETYKKFSNFSYNQAWDFNTNKYSTTISEFNIIDLENGTSLSFKIQNNIVIEIKVSVR